MGSSGLEKDDTKSAWTISWIALAMAILFVSSVWLSWLQDSDGKMLEHRDSANPIGWSAIATAIICFGFSETPIKVSEAQEMGAQMFNSYCYIGNGIGHCSFIVFLLILHQPFQWQWEATLAAVDLAIVQCFAREAIMLLGVAVAPPLWCSVGILTSFAWGTMAFGDRPNHLVLSLAGLAFIIAGIGFVSRAGSLSVNEDEDNRSLESQPLREASTMWVSSKLVKGLGYAFVAGIADGSVIAFYQHMEAHSRTSAALFGYFCTFGLTMLCIGMFQLVLAYGTNQDSKIEMLVAEPWRVLRKIAPGLISGALWAGANSCSVLSSHYLGMAVSFPLTQTACVISGLLGLFVFAEITSTRARVIFCSGLVTILIGAFLLSSYGRSDTTPSH